MNIYENIIEDVKAKKAKTNAIDVLEKIKGFLNQIKNKTIYAYNTYEHEREKMNVSGYSTAFVQEWEEKERGKYEQSVKNAINKFIDDMTAEFKNMKDKAMIYTGDKSISTNNLLKFQTILPTMTGEDKRSFFEYAADTDPNILEVLYFNVKESDAYLAGQILEKINQYTGANQINIVEKEIEQLKQIYSYLSYDAVKSMGDGFSQVDGISRFNIEGTVDMLLNTFVDEIDKKIKLVKSMED